MKALIQKIIAVAKLVAINLIVLWVLLNITGYLVAKHHFSVLQNRYEKGALEQSIVLEKVFRVNLAGTRPLPQYVGVYDTLTYYWNAQGSYDLAVFDANYTARHNAYGLRVQHNKTPQSTRSAIAILGDSHAYGIGVEDEETYAHHLGSKGHPVALVACSSFGTAREFLKTQALCRAGIIDTPEVLVVHYCPNDLDENMAFVNNNNALKIKSEASFRENYVQDVYTVTFAEVYDKLPVYMSFPLLVRGISNKLNAAFSRRSLTYFTHPNADDSNTSTIDNQPETAFKNVVQHFLTDSVFEHVRQVIVLNAMSPVYHTRAEIESEETMLSASAAHLQEAFPKVTFTTLYFPEEKQEQWYFNMDDHTNAAGHLWYADTLSSLVRKRHAR